MWPRGGAPVCERARAAESTAGTSWRAESTRIRHFGAPLHGVDAGSEWLSGVWVGACSLHEHLQGIALVMSPVGRPGGRTKRR